MINTLHIYFHGKNRDGSNLKLLKNFGNMNIITRLNKCKKCEVTIGSKEAKNKRNSLNNLILI